MSLFSIDILEPSLTKRPSTPRIPLQTLSSTSTIVPPVIPAKTEPKKEEPGPPRWNTPEFYFYAFVFIVVVPQMVWCAWDVSRGTFPYVKGS
jgi:protein-cysteine N-palmitoyltransferase HHAT